MSHIRPDIAFVVSLVSQYKHDSYSVRLVVVFQILRYLNSTLGKGLLSMKHDHSQIEASSYVDRKSTSNYATFVGGNLFIDGVKSKMLLFTLGLKQNLGHWLMTFVRCCGLRNQWSEYVINYSHVVI